MADSKEGILPLVGRVIKKRLTEVKEEVSRELGEGLGDLRRELEDDIEGGEPKSPAAEPRTGVRIDTERK